MLLYLCNAFDEPVKRERGIVTDSPAASRKVFGVARALSCAGMDVAVLSLGRGRQDGSGRRFAHKKTDHDGITVAYAAFWHMPVLTHLVSAFSMLVLVMAYRKQGAKRVLAYNRCIHYLPALMYARLAGMQSFLELDDGWLRQPGIFQRFLGWLYDRLCADGALLACRALAGQVRVKKIQVCYGAIDPEACQTVDVAAKWRTRPIRFLFGGTLNRETGAVLFIDGMRVFSARYPELCAQVRVTVTGFGEMAGAFERLAREESMREWLEFRGRVSGQEYARLLESCHVGMCLKLSSDELHGTTFPSKVIEYAEHGLLVLSTPVSDVPELFTGEQALILTADDPGLLADAMAWCVRRHDEARDRAAVGLTMVRDRLSFARTGSELRAFLEGCAG